MKKVFTLALVMAMAITSFAQVKGMRKSDRPDPSTMRVTKGLEEVTAVFPASTRNMMTLAPEETELSYTTYDWQSNQGPRNFTAVWPDGFAVMCYTQATSSTYADRGTGLAIWDPAVGEWEYTDERVEGVKTGFGSIARYKENGLVIAAHTATDCRIFIVEDFRDGNRDFGEGIVLPVETGVDPVWPAVQCSGENLDIVHVLVTNSGASAPYSDPIVYYQWVDGEWTRQYEIIPNIDGDNVSDGGSNITYFMQYNPEKPDRVAFVINNAWSDGKAVVSEDNGATWTDRVFYKHPDINGDFTDTWFFYPRWTTAEFDDDDNLNVVYEWNGTTGTSGSGSYYPGVGGVAFWSETLPKNELCIGGIGNVGEPFIMDSAYTMNDLYYSEWYWSDATHDPVPEYFGELMILDEESNVVDYTGVLPENYMWVDLNVKSDHGAYNCGISSFASMHREGDDIVAFWSMIAGDSQTLYFDGTNHYFRLFGARSTDGGLTWSLPKHLITDIMNIYDEMVYGVVIPYVYYDAEGAYVWYCYQNDQETGTFVMGDESTYDNNCYRAVKVYIPYVDVEENPIAVATTINVYPNPAQGSFNVALNNVSDVNIYNAVGQLVKTYNNVSELNVSLEAGVYFVNAGNQTVKVVVK